MDHSCAAHALPTGVIKVWVILCGRLLRVLYVYSYMCVLWSLRL